MFGDVKLRFFFGFLILNFGLLIDYFLIIIRYGKWNIIIIKMEVIDNNTKNPSKIKPFQTFTKIQENRPSLFDNLVNKELGYDTLI